MEAEKFKPLPDHTRLDYNECCAKLLLEELFPSRYPELKLADKPDLQGQSVGIEVTIADSEKHKEALNNWIKANNCTDENKKAKYTERMNQLGVEYTGGIQCWTSINPSFALTRNAVDTKIKKLKKGTISVLIDTNYLFLKTHGFTMALLKLQKTIYSTSPLATTSKLYMFFQKALNCIYLRQRRESIRA